MSLSLWLHAREHSEADSDDSVLRWDDIDENTVARLKKYSAISQENDLTVSFYENGSIDGDGCVLTIGISPSSPDLLTINTTKRVKHMWPVDVEATGILAISSIESAVEKAARIPGEAAVGVIPNSSGYLFLFQELVVETDIEINDAVYDQMSEEPEGDAFQRMAKISDSIVYAGAEVFAISTDEDSPRSVFPAALSDESYPHETYLDAAKHLVAVRGSQPQGRLWAYSDPKAVARALWEDLGNMPVAGRDSGERIESGWLHFKAATPVYDIWHWFEKEFDLSVAVDLMYLEGK